jgi:uncharacterized protein YdaL
MQLVNFSRKAVTSIIFLLIFLGGSSNAFSAPRQVLILHDSSGPTGFVGKDYAILLENLLGHFDSEITVQPVSSYTEGTIEEHDATFYIGSTFNEESYLTDQPLDNYRSFIKDAATSSKPLAWLNNNLSNLIEQWDPSWGAETFTEKTGIEYIGAIPDLHFNRVKYKNVELNKGVAWDNSSGKCVPENEADAQDDSKKTYVCAGELVTIDIVDPSLAQQIASAYTTLQADIGEHEYITRSGDFWFVGDIPFTFLSAEDRYLAFADILHDILGTGVEHEEQSPTALLRLEDVSAGIDPALFKNLLDYLDKENIPFSIAAVPSYEDPKGNDPLSAGAARSIKLPHSEIAKIIEPYYKKNLLSIIAHGYTHQYSNLENPFDGVTGKDWEFYRVDLAEDGSPNFVGPTPEDSAQWAKERMCKTDDLLRQANFKAFAWETPHYLASQEDYHAIKELYPVHYGRAAYFNPERPDGKPINQLFPYVIKKDAYGYHQIPENIGNIQTTPRPGFRVSLPEDLIRAAEKMKVVRDGVASFYYHPYLPTEDLGKTIAGIKALGYTFKAPCSLSPAGCPDPNTDITSTAQCDGVVQSDSGESGSGGGSPGVIWLLLMAAIRLNHRQK